MELTTIIDKRNPGDDNLIRYVKSNVAVNISDAVGNYLISMLTMSKD